MKFLHLSDLHFHRNKSDNKAVNEMFNLVKQRYPKHRLIITGDIVDDGHSEQYERAYEALKPFEGLVFICPGNHDFGAAGNFFSKERAKRFDEMLSGPLHQGGSFFSSGSPVVNVLREKENDIMLIALDSNLETSHPFDFACGEIGESQLGALTAILNNPTTTYMKKIMFFHHHPFIHHNPFMELKDAKELMRTIYLKVNLLLFGHKHRGGLWPNMNGIEYIVVAENTPGQHNSIKEITITSKGIELNDVPLT